MRSRLTRCPGLRDSLATCSPGGDEARAQRPAFATSTWRPRDERDVGRLDIGRALLSTPWKNWSRCSTTRRPPDPSRRRSAECWTRPTAKPSAEINLSPVLRSPTPPHASSGRVECQQCRDVIDRQASTRSRPWSQATMRSPPTIDGPAWPEDSSVENRADGRTVRCMVPSSPSWLAPYVRLSILASERRPLS